MAWDVTKPADSDLVRNFPPLHRIDKTTLRDELQVEHDVLPATGSGTGRHRFPRGNAAARPSNLRDGSLYIRDDIDVIEFWDGASARPVGVPTGSVICYAASTPPAGWLLCNGQAVSRTTYARLFAVIGTTYGAGDGSTTFNVPNVAARVVVGQDAGHPEFVSLGQAGGSKTHTLTVGEIPSHSHGVSVSDPGHTHGVTDPGHTHPTWHFRDPGEIRPIDSSNYSGPQGSPTSPATTGISINTATTGVSVSLGNTGGGAPHNNLQPYIVMHYIIKT